MVELGEKGNSNRGIGEKRCSNGGIGMEKKNDQPNEDVVKKNERT